jgi:5-methylcytosine-specific restriction enzyme subunit McrC
VRPWEIRFRCLYKQQTSDVPDNQIIAWTFDRLRRSPIGHLDAQRAMLRGHRALQGTIALVTYRAKDCTGRTYNRLNQDYKTLHALCRFFLESSGPSHAAGTYGMVPFLVDMDRLFELFVAEWMKVHVPMDRFLVQAQESITASEATWLQFRVDLALVDRQTGKAWCVLDTKYKASGTVDQGDVSQVVTYAKLKGAAEAVLIYPSPPALPLNAMYGDVRVRTCTFSLQSNHEKAGGDFLHDLLPEQ